MVSKAKGRESGKDGGIHDARGAQKDGVYMAGPGEQGRGEREARGQGRGKRGGRRGGEGRGGDGPAGLEEEVDELTVLEGFRVGGGLTGNVGSVAHLDDVEAAVGLDVAEGGREVQDGREGLVGGKEEAGEDEDVRA
jgi:hypothetical protein